MRAGSYTLALLATPRVPTILRSLAGGSKSRQELRCDTGFPAHSTLRNQLDGLRLAGILAKSRSDAPPEVLEYGLTDSGRALLAVLNAVTAWLAAAPDGELELTSDAARAAIKALSDGWLVRMLAPLSERPHSLTELDKRLPHASYPTLERRLESLRLTQQVEELPRSNRGTPHAATEWLRRGIGPIAHAVRWEHEADPEEASPVTRLELDSALTIAAPLLALAPKASGVCQFAARSPVAGSRDRSLYMVEVQSGRVSSSGVYPSRKPDVWASGKAEDWFVALMEGDARPLRLSGDRDLAIEIFERAREVLTGDSQEIASFPK